MPRKKKLSKKFTRLCDTVAQNSGKGDLPIRKKNENSYNKMFQFFFALLHTLSNVVFLYQRCLTNITITGHHADTHLLETKYTGNVDSFFVENIFVVILSRFTTTCWKCQVFSQLLTSCHLKFQLLHSGQKNSQVCYF